MCLQLYANRSRVSVSWLYSSRGGGGCSTVPTAGDMESILPLPFRPASLTLSGIEVVFLGAEVMSDPQAFTYLYCTYGSCDLLIFANDDIQYTSFPRKFMKSLINFILFSIHFLTPVICAAVWLLQFQNFCTC
jgi:hypothetical protein